MRLLIAVPLFLLPLGACMAVRPAPEAAASAPKTFRERIATLVVKEVQFGSISLLPVRFEHSRITPYFEDGGRTLYCISTQMRGRTLFKPERPKAVVQEERGTEKLKILHDENDVCSGHRTEPFPELDALDPRKS